MQNVLVTGGAGFIGSNFLHLLLARRSDVRVTNLDKLNYSGNLENLADIAGDPRYRFVHGDIADAATVEDVFRTGFDTVINFAAETHVDRSIEDAAPFLHTNVNGTYTLLEAVRRYRVPRFVQISTDEVYGSAPAGESFDENAHLNPASPYSASKTAADHLVKAYAVTYGVPAVILRCTNNFGPFQFPEKLVPLMIANALENKSLPVYGDGLHERDWLYVEDFCQAILRVCEAGRTGEVYNVSAGTPRPNLLIVRTILQQLGKPEALIQHVKDRPGHDRRYALNSSKLRAELGWEPQVSFEEGIRRTVAWYRANPEWLERTRSGQYRQYYERHYGRREQTFQTFTGSAP
jgi:dTDP-glucose 4,6-dehydratase